MKKIQKLCFLALVGLMVGTSCEKTAQNNPVPVSVAPTPCEYIEGVVIAELRRGASTPGVAYSSCETVVQIKNRNIGVQWGNLSNCLVIRNLDASLSKFNQKIYFKTFTELTWPECDPQPNGGPLDCIPVGMCINAANISTECK